MTETPKFSVNKRLIKSGNGLYVAVPNEVISQWNLNKGDEVKLSVLDGALKIQPTQPVKVETISEEAVETYARVMKGIQAKITLGVEESTIHLEFSGENKEAVNLLLNNLWRNLPALFRMLGIGLVEEQTQGETGNKV